MYYPTEPSSARASIFKKAEKEMSLETSWNGYVKRETVYGYMLPGQLWDIGTIEGYNELKREFQTRK